MITIYVQNKPLYLSEKSDPELKALHNRQDTVSADEFNSNTVPEVLAKIEQNDIKAGIIIHDDETMVLEALKTKLFLIQAAGGFVYTPDHFVLLIYRRGKWDLPKGKLDEGEVLRDCAEREVMEETGISDVTVKEPLTVTYHTYFERNKHVLKESHWFLISAKSKVVLHPQTEEDIERCEWVHVNELPLYFENMHHSIIDVIKEGVIHLSK